TPTSEPTATPPELPTATPIPPTPTTLVVTAQPRPATPIAAQPRPATPTTAQPAANGEHVFPVRPARAATYGSCHHDYPASDIFVPIGSEFVAVTDGVVEFVTYTDEWSPQNDDPVIRGGISVAMVGSDGVRYYGSHLSAVVDGIAPGVRVAAGQALGKTGKTGNAASTPPHLHFGISPPTTPDDWQTRRGTINPLPYLNAWKSGKNVTPDLSRVGGGAC
ncbi:MAG: M23 family metallopeptidase, partial [Chloroflexi bacterium]|nr:M23 family metallopeptidase [Chloroflexota bacterium]